MTLWTDEYGIKRVVIGCFLKGVELGRRSYFGHFIYADKKTWPKDVKYSSTCASSSVTYDNIEIDCITSWDLMGIEARLKRPVIWSLYSSADEAVAPTLSVRADYGRKSASIDTTKSTHSAITGSLPDDGEDKVNGWDYQDCQYQPLTVPACKGVNLSFRYYEDSQKAVDVFGYKIELEVDEEALSERV